ncbi:MAG: outer membrane beta-barrel protein, partial [Martelella sp.]
MRNLVIGMAMASTVLASPALARDDQWYVQVQGGPMLVEDLDFDVNGQVENLTADYDTGYDFGGVIGYDFGPFRLEAEGSYRAADINSIQVGSEGFPLQLPGLPVRSLTPSTAPATGDISSLSFLVNGLFDLGDDDGLQGFIGGGVGVARTQASISINPTNAPGLDDSDTGFAWQLLGGVRAPLT